MPLFKPVLIFASLLLFLSAHAEDESAGLSTALSPELGVVITDVSPSIVSPDGSGLPQGSGSVFTGEQLYKVKCAACHGIDGRQSGNQLVGGRGSLSSAQPMKTVGSFWPYATTLYDYIARAMPYDQQKTLSVGEVYAVTAYVLKLNGILGHGDTLNQDSLPKVKMPNQDGFIELLPRAWKFPGLLAIPVRRWVANTLWVVAVC